MKQDKGTPFQKKQSSAPERGPRLSELIRVYQDMERTLRLLKRNTERSVAAESINMRKLIERLSKSKRRLERKIGDALLTEKEQFKRRFNRLLKA